MKEIIINNHEGMLTVSSLQVAEHFKKQHKHVLDAIENIKAENSAVTPMFIESTYQAGTGKNYKCYEMTRDGFCLLVMGFTGKKALDWKLKYIDAFNQMEEQLRNFTVSPFNVEEIISKTVTETIKILLPMLSATETTIETSRVTASDTKDFSNSSKLKPRQRCRYRTPSKISQLAPDVKAKVEEMIASGCACQKIANFITNTTGMEISQMAVSRYRSQNFVITEDAQLPLSWEE